MSGENADASAHVQSSSSNGHVSFLKQAHPYYIELLPDEKNKNDLNNNNNDEMDNDDKAATEASSADGMIKVLTPHEFFNVSTSHLVVDESNGYGLKDSKKRKRNQRSNGSATSESDDTSSISSSDSSSASESSSYSRESKSTSNTSGKKRKSKEKMKNLVDLKSKVLEELYKSYMEINQLQAILKFVQSGEKSKDKFHVLSLEPVERQEATRKKQLTDLAIHFLKRSDDVAESSNILVNGLKSLEITKDHLRKQFYSIRNLQQKWKLEEFPGRRGPRIMVDFGLKTCGIDLPNDANKVQGLSSLVYAPLMQEEDGSVTVKGSRSVLYTLRVEVYRRNSHEVFSSEVFQNICGLSIPINQDVDDNDNDNDVDGNRNDQLLEANMHDEICRVVFKCISQDAIARGERSGYFHNPEVRPEDTVQIMGFDENMIRVAVLGNPEPVDLTITFVPQSSSPEIKNASLSGSIGSMLLKKLISEKQTTGLLQSSIKMCRNYFS